jgi:hypothetical protein
VSACVFELLTISVKRHRARVVLHPQPDLVGMGEYSFWLNRTASNTDGGESALVGSDPAHLSVAIPYMSVPMDSTGRLRPLGVWLFCHVIAHAHQYHQHSLLQEVQHHRRRWNMSACWSHRLCQRAQLAICVVSTGTGKVCCSVGVLF